MASRLYYLGLLLVTSGVLIGEVAGFGKGAPDSEVICNTLTPKHKDKLPQTSASPYGIYLDKTSVAPGDVVTLTITGDFANNVTLKGLLVQGRKSNYEKQPAAVGRFMLDAKAKETHRGVKCADTENSSVTHIDNSEKFEVNVKWIAPDEVGNYVLLSTIVKDGYTFWVRQPSQNITVLKPLAYGYA